MGASISIGLRPEEIADLQSHTPWGQQDIKVLFRRFRRLDRGNRGVIGSQDILAVPEVAMNPLAGRVTALIEAATDLDGDGGYMLNFRSFVRALAVFSPKTPLAAKVRFAFDLYDVDGDGFVSRGDLSEIMGMLVGDDNVDADALAEMVKATIAQHDVDGDGQLSPKEFYAALGDTEVVREHLTFDLTHLYDEDE
uniref:EF-hand domain-containing protein n=1 Tax=Bicosoecida sp. CB-2014 TaxID=1486930 RepID=A0A7S1CAZ7_9STRA|mmetsp:Transcript_18113/g.64135  ORF Transcript_18113/g.64135 Transcript_18113/m.64135 type:complete len:195 (+) Transcript_18113:176-760(+)